MIIGKQMDWLQGTVSGYATIADILPEYKFTRIQDGAHGYRDLLVNEETGIRVQQKSMRSDMGTHIQFGGSALSVLRSNGLIDKQLIERLSYYEFRTSRVDLCIDVIDGLVMPKDYKKMSEDGRMKSRMGNPALVEKVKDGIIGTTLYIGERVSERFIRIYDKRAEQRVYLAGNWVRHEIVFKDEKAKAIFGALSQHTLSSVVNAAFDAAVKFDCEEYRAITSGEHAHIDSVPRKQTNTEKWLMDTVVKSLAKTIVVYPFFARQFFDAVKDEVASIKKRD
jgi:hypothetical protein